MLLVPQEFIEQPFYFGEKGFVEVALNLPSWNIWPSPCFDGFGVIGQTVFKQYRFVLPVYKPDYDGRFV